MITSLNSSSIFVTFCLNSVSIRLKRCSFRGIPSLFTGSGSSASSFCLYFSHSEFRGNNYLLLSWRAIYKHERPCVACVGLIRSWHEGCFWFEGLLSLFSACAGHDPVCSSVQAPGPMHTPRDTAAALASSGVHDGSDSRTRNLCGRGWVVPCLEKEAPMAVAHIFLCAPGSGALLC